MSLVADGPLIMVSGASGSSRPSDSGTPRTTWSAVTTQTRQSGSSVRARRPHTGEPSSTIVPVSAIATAAPVSEAARSASATASPPGSSATPSGRHPAGTPGAASTDDGAQPSPRPESSASVTVAATSSGPQRSTDAL